LLGDIVELDAQIASRDQDIRILVETIMQCAQKYQIESEYLHNRFKKLSTLKMQIK